MAKKLTLQDKIQEIQPYFRGIEVKETLFILRVVYPNRWSAYNRDDEIIKVAKSDVNATENEWFYYASVNDIDLTEMFDLVKETVKTNEDMHHKIELMRTKMEELKELFQSEPLDKLQTLYFAFNETPKRKTKRKKQKIEVPQEQLEKHSQDEKAETNQSESQNISVDEIEEMEKGWV